MILLLVLTHPVFPALQNSYLWHCGAQNYPRDRRAREQVPAGLKSIGAVRTGERTQSTAQVLINDNSMFPQPFRNHSFGIAEPKTIHEFGKQGTLFVTDSKKHLETSYLVRRGSFLWITDE